MIIILIATLVAVYFTFNTVSFYDEFGLSIETFLFTLLGMFVLSLCIVGASVLTGNYQVKSSQYEQIQEPVYKVKKK